MNKIELNRSHLYNIRPQSINCLVDVSFAMKNTAGGQKQRSSFFFEEKHMHTLPVGYLTCYVK